MVDAGLTMDAISGALSELETWSTRPDAALWYGLFWAEGARV
jgi:hypothetical protein